jgi:hypothetical protein
MKRNFEWQNQLLNFSLVGESSKNLWTLSFEKKCVLVFLRHFGCLFCKNMVANIFLEKDWLKQQRYHTVFIHQSDPLVSKEFFKQFGFESYLEISDPYRSCYKAFEIGSANLFHLLNPKAIYGAWDSYQQGHRMSEADGNVWQMPGLVILHEGEILKRHQFSHVGEMPSIRNVAN